jgi:sortase A
MSSMSVPAPPEPGFTSPGLTGKPRSLGALMGAALRRPGGRRALSVLSLVLFVAGVGMFSWPAYTDLIAHWRQSHLNHQFSTPQLQQAYQACERTKAVDPKAETCAVANGQPLTTLVSKRMGINVLVVQGTSPSALKAGAGHYPGSALPCDKGNVAIAGHRTTYGRPFNKIDTMRPGDIVELITPFNDCKYQTVTAFGGHDNPWVVAPDDYSVIDVPGRPAGAYWLTLTSCHPKGSASHRIVLRLKLVEKCDSNGTTHCQAMHSA